MATADQGASRATQLPSQVRVTVLADRRGRPLWRRVAAPRARTTTYALGGLVLLVAAVATIVAGSLAPGRARAPSAAPAQAREPGAAGVAAAYGFPPRCLSVTILADDPSYARADFNRSSACGRFAGDATAIFHRVDRTWRPVLETLGYSCPVASLPRAVQVGLAICPEP